MFIYLIFLNFSFCQFVDRKFTEHCKNQALIANYSMVGWKGCFTQCLSAFTIYAEENLFVKGLLFRFYSIFNAFSQRKTSVILLQAQCCSVIR